MTNIPSSSVPDNTFISYMLYLITRDEEFVSTYSQFIEPDAFDTTELSFLFRQAKEFYAKYNGVLPTEALEMTLNAIPEQKGFDKELVVQLYEEAPEPSPELALYVTEYAASWFQKKMMLSTVDELTDLLESGRVDQAKKLMSSTVEGINVIGEEDYGTAIFSDSESMISLLLNEDDGMVGIPTGMKSVDKIIRGGLRGGELGVWMAPPGGGKSQALIFTAREAVMSGHNAIYYTLEMDTYYVLQRFWAGILDIGTEEMEENMGYVIESMRPYLDKAEENGWGELIIKRYPTRGASVANLSGHIHSLERKGWRPDVIMVDYADILAGGEKRYDARRDDLAMIYEDLRGMGQTENIPIWTACQANREGFKTGRLRMDHIADSWDKAKIADYIFGECQTEEDKREGKMLVAPIKVRNNAAGPYINFNVDFSRSLFYDRGLSYDE